MATNQKPDERDHFLVDAENVTSVIVGDNPFKALLTCIITEH